MRRLDHPRLADLNERIRHAEGRLVEVRDELESLRGELVDEAELSSALAAFDLVWEQLSLQERARIIQLLVERVEYDGRTGDVAITFHSSGIETLVAEIEQETAA